MRYDLLAVLMKLLKSQDYIQFDSVSEPGQDKRTKKGNGSQDESSEQTSAGGHSLLILDMQPIIGCVVCLFTLVVSSILRR